MSQSLTKISPFYGIWPVQECLLDPEDSEKRWQKVIFQSPDTIIVQKESGELKMFEAAIDLQNHKIILKQKDVEFQLSFVEDTAIKSLGLTGFFDGGQMDVRLSRINESEFTLLNRGFHWINEYPYNR